MLRAAIVAGLACLVALAGFVLVSTVAGRDDGGALLELVPVAGDRSEGARPAGTGKATPPRAVSTSATAVGDSVLLAAADVLRRDLPGIDIDAVVGRGVPDGIRALKERAAAGKLGDLVLVHLGNNGEFSEAQFEEIAAIAGPQRRLVFVTVRVPRSWEGPNNEVIARGVARHGNAVLVDWHGASAARLSLLWDDGVHLRPEGVKAYSELIVRSLPR